MLVGIAMFGNNSTVCDGLSAGVHVKQLVFINKIKLVY